jgi:hypothetical protein
VKKCVCARAWFKGEHFELAIIKTGQVERGYRRVRAPVNTSRGNVPYVILAQNI